MSEDCLGLKRIFLGVAFFVSMTAASASATCYDPRLVIAAMKDPRSGNWPVVLAHRGVWQDDKTNRVILPENSLASLNRANVECIEGVELDVKTTKDGVPVVMHDFRLGGTTDIYKLEFTDAYDAMKDSGTNPFVSERPAFIFNLMKLKPYRDWKSPPNNSFVDSKPPLVRDIYDDYYKNKMSLVLVWDVKSAFDALAIAKLLDEDDRDFAHGSIKDPATGKAIPLYASDITVFKINATVYPYPIWYLNDMMSNGVRRIPKIIPIYTTNMESALREKFNISPFDSLRSWMIGAGGEFLSPEINLKEQDGLLNDSFAAGRASYPVGVFNAIPDFFGRDPSVVSVNPPPSTGKFYKNTGACCYELKDLFQKFRGREDKSDNRGSWAFLRSQKFGVLTSDQPGALIRFLKADGARNTVRYGVAPWCNGDFICLGARSARVGGSEPQGQ